MAPPPFQLFLEAHRHEVMRVLRATVGPDDADDCFQETFLAALRAYPRLGDHPDPRAWVLTIGHRKAIDSARATARRPVPVDAVPDAGAEGRRTDHHAGLWAMVRNLPPKQRAAVAHRFVADLSYREMATVMDCSEEAARRSVHEGLKRLREEIER